MKLNQVLNLLVLGSVLTVTAVGCKTHPQNTTPLPGERNPIVDPNLNGNNLGGGAPLNPPPSVGMGGAGGITPPNGPNHPGWQENADILKLDTVYFDFDKSAIKSGERSKLDKVAEYLKGDAAAAVRIEGNCDERGTEEYNKSLGERRALAGREYLIQLGISADRVDTLTRGEDNPADTGHGESAWSKNRRDEFIVLHSPTVQ